MPDYAKVGITGRLVREPKQNTYNDSTVISFTVAVYTTKKVDDKYVSDFYNVSFWGKQAETVFPKLDKGTLVQVYGDLYQEEYTDKSGAKRQGMSIRATEVICLDQNKKSTSTTKKQTEEDPF